MLSYNTYFHKLGTIFSNNLNIKGTTSQLDSLSQLEHIEFMHIQLVTIPRASTILNLIKNTKMNLLGIYLLSLLPKISVILFFSTIGSKKFYLYCLNVHLAPKLKFIVDSNRELQQVLISYCQMRYITGLHSMQMQMDALPTFSLDI
jgi:hypothetical protein